jgi:small subunit ribosomal protein S8
MTDSNRRHAHADPQRGDRQAHARRHARVAAQGRDRRILQDEGYISGFKVLDEAATKTTPATKTLRLFLKYGPHGEKLITGVERISRPGRRVYFGRDDVPDVLAGLGTSILTTSRGVMTGRAAVKAGVGGEVLCNIW